MSNEEQTSSLISFVNDECTYKQEDVTFIHQQYEILKEFLGGRVFQSGSYARETAINPINDLDIIWILPVGIRSDYNTVIREVRTILDELVEELRRKYLQKGIHVKISPQEHSILIEFPEKKGDFTIDVVPAYETSESNGLGAYYFRIPEVGLVKRPQREYIVKRNLERNVPMNWLKTDPKGYIEMGRRMQDKYEYYRPTVKLIKKWKNELKEEISDKEKFKLKSFHIEQIVHDLLQRYKYTSPLQLLLDFFQKIPTYVNTPLLKDLAQDTGTTRYIDDYVKDLNEIQRKNITYFAKCAHSLLSESSIDFPEYLYRLLSLEEFITAKGFQYTSQTVMDKTKFEIQGTITNKPLQNHLSRTETQKQQIVFKCSHIPVENQELYWKVRNTGDEAIKVRQLRGEITRDHTKSSPEETAYRGDHNVTCFLVNSITRNIIAEDTVVVRIDHTLKGERIVFTVQIL